MRIVAMLTLTFLITQLTLGQSQLAGSVQDTDQMAVPFTTVSLMSLPDSTVVNGTTTDLDGHFELTTSEVGTYVLKFSAIGFTSAMSPSFELSQDDQQKDFEVVSLKAATTELEEVKLTSWRPKVETQNGTMVVRVENTAMAAGSSAYEVVSRSPGISADQDGNIQMNGKGGVNVLIDGRTTYLSGQDLKAFLESMPADNIEKIELMTQPSSKYDAEGTGGILNIHLKKNTLSGISGSVYASGRWNQQDFYNAGANLGYSKGRWNSYLNLGYREDGFIRDQFSQRNYGQDTRFTQTGEDRNKSKTPSLQLGVDYDLNPNHTIGTMINIHNSKTKQDWNTLTQITSSSEQDNMHIDARNHMNDESSNNRFNLNYTGKLDTLGTTLSANLDYIRLDTDSQTQFHNQYTSAINDSSTLEELSSNTPSKYDIYSARLDFSLAIGKQSQLETGVKISKVTSDSELRFYIHDETEKILDPQRSNEFLYEEEIYAGYLSFQTPLSNSWNLRAGLRAEQTLGKGKSVTLDEENSRDYLEFFPSLNLEQNVSDSYKINYSYSRRIVRPPYGQLNPFIFYLDPKTYIIGNTELQPQFSSSFEIAQSLFDKYHLSLGYDQTQGYIAEIPRVDPDTGITEYTVGNLEGFNSWNARLVAPVQLANFWNTTNTLVYNHQNYQFFEDNRQRTNKNNFFMLQSTHQLSLPLGIGLELMGMYQGKVAYSLYQLAPMAWLDIAVKKSFVQDKLELSLQALDVFGSREMDVSSDYIADGFKIRQYFGNQAISLSLRYNFSNGTQTSPREQTNALEELDRATGN